MLNGAWPAGAIDAAHVPLVLARAVWLCALLSATGALVFRAADFPLRARPSRGERVGVRWVVAPLRRWNPRPSPPQRGGEGVSFRLIGASLGVAGGAWAVWVVLQSAAIAGADGPAEAFAALTPVFSRTLFGHVALVQIGLLAVAAATMRRRMVPAGCALAATALQVGHLHAWAMGGGGSLLTWAVVLHVLAAALWLGGLVPLWLVVRTAPLAVAIPVVRRFSARATVLVAVLAATAFYQALQMVGGLPGLFGSFYGWVALAKAALFAAMLALAWRNRFVLTPALARDERAALARSIAVETAVGVAVVVAACVLTSLPPGMHGQPVWPFTLRPRLPPDPVLLAAVAGIALLLGAAVLRTVRWPALAGICVLALLAGPRLGAAMQPATPTSFYQSQTGFTAASVAGGAATFAAHCASCHADGPRLAADDGDLFWTLASHPDGALDDDARWNLIDFLRARAAVGAWPVRAPDVQLACADGSTPMLSDLRGRAVRIAFRPVAGACAVTDPDGLAAYAVATGLTTAQLAGVEWLIDADGRLRDAPHPGAQVGLR